VLCDTERKLKARVYQKERYKNDEAFREKKKQKRLHYYYLNKQNNDVHV
jgi:hypothetical protein